MSREADLYKDKIEVSLDGRQIFYLFFGGAVIVGLVFVLGVMVGRRVEARGHVDRARTTAAADPLAALDRLEGNGGLSFKGTLMAGKSATDAPSDVEKQIVEIEKARAAKPAELPKVEPKVEPPKVEPKVEAKDQAKKDEAKDEAKVEAKKDEKKDDKKDDKKDEKKDEKKLDEKKLEAKKTDEKKLDEKKLDEKKLDEKKLDAAKQADGPVVKPEKIADKPKTDDVEKPKVEEEKKHKYTLQLSSFQDRTEADAFLSSIKASGYQAHITEATVAGKGTFYRVRMGTYRSLEAANDAKAEFEKSSKKTASVMRL